MPKELPKAYEPQEYEDKIYKKWEESGFFNPDNLKLENNAESFTISMPPPNVTGVLHLGHALENSIMDIEVRYQRMKGKRAMIVPGTDHAAVATQARVEKNLIAGGIKNPREELGREELLNRIREYAEQSKSTIINQIKRLGTSCDWSRLAYTFDEERSRCVNEIFERMYKDGLIYKGYRVINWSIKGQSTCSDDELVYVERKTKSYTFKYAKDFPIAITTVRPETKLGDTAVAVNPKDKRYKEYVGKTYTVDVGALKPLKIKIIADKSVDSEFGSGAVGVTPAHSMIDYEMAQNHKLPLVQVIGQDGKMTEEAGKNYQGLKVDEARERFVEWLRKNDLIIKEEEIVHNASTSDRFGDVIEIIPMNQWWVDVNKKIPGRKKSLRDLMKEAMTNGLNGDKAKKVTINPKRFTKLYLDRIDNLRDWCLSRQIWWGHRIPVWYKDDKIKVSEENPGKGWTQDEDTLDTWFSSGTWTFSTLGWPGGEVEILATRHGDTDIHNGSRFVGQEKEVDYSLNEEGKRQAEELAKKLKDEKIDAIFSSDMKRTKETAEIVNQFHNLKIIVDVRLREYRFGYMSGLTQEEIKEKYPDAPGWKEKEIDHQYKDEERPIEVKNRVDSFIKELGKYKGKKVLLVTHAGVLDFFPMIFDKKKFEYIKDLHHKKCELEKYKLKIDEDLKKYHPTAWMQMGYEILYLWLMRMILMSVYALDDIPFKEAYIHGMLRAKDGRKFSKSLGNGLDPIDVIEKYGTDALRLSLISGTTPGNDSRFYEEKVEEARNFINKLWNIYRYAISNYELTDKNYNLDDIKFTLADKWILDEFESLKKAVDKFLDKHDFSLASEILKEFTWNKLADWYLEICKFEKGDNKEKIINSILKDLLKLWHPFMPFVTEILWKEFSKEKLLLVEKWPSGTGNLNIKPSDKFDLIKDIIIAIRNARSENKVEPSKKIKAIIYAGDKVKLIKSQEVLIKSLRTGIEELEITEKGKKIDNTIYASVGKIEIYLLGAKDEEKEKARIKKEIENKEKMISGIEAKLKNKDFIDKAPKEIVKKEKERLKLFKEELKNLKNKN